MVMDKALQVAGESWFKLGLEAFVRSDFYIYGMVALERGFVLNSMIFAAITVFVIEKEFIKAAIWSVFAALLSFTGLIHSFRITESGIVGMMGINAAPYFSISYCMMGVAFFFAGYFQRAKE